MGTRTLLSASTALIASIVVACSRAPAEDQPEETGSTESELTKGCSLARATILSTASPKRKHVVERGFTWLDDDVPYSQSASHQGYRTDCSGFVSMCWELGRSSNTSAFYSGDANSRLGSYEELLVADALVKQGHMMIFLGWNDQAHSGACVLEQASTASDMQFRVRTTSSLKSEGYKAIRADKLATDTTGPTETPTCVPKSAEAACAAAKSASGFECGRTSDGCGGTVSCDGVASFGCAADESCSQNHRCVRAGCVSPPSAETCAAKGAECGVVEDVCGESIDCSTVGLGCSATERCSADPHCEAEDTAGSVSPESGDPGDDSAPVSRNTKKRSYELTSAGCQSSSRAASPLSGLLAIFAAIAVVFRRRRS